MALFNCNEFANLTPQAKAGIGGGPTMNRAAQEKAAVQGGIASYTVPNASAPQNGDSLQLIPRMEVTARLLRMKARFDGFGANATIGLGKIDPNNSANTDTVHYLAQSAAAVAGEVDANKNLGEQVGADPAGDQSTGNLAPAFGNAPIIPTLTFAGANPAAGANIIVITEFMNAAG